MNAETRLPRWSVAALLAVALFLIMVPSAMAAEEVEVDGVLHVRNDATPRDGMEVWKLEELWRAGAADDRTNFGVIAGAVSDESGRVYLLDQQLDKIFIYTRGGSLFKAFGQSYKGLGDFTRGEDMFVWPSGKLGVAQRNPARIVTLEPSGEKVDFVYPDKDKDIAASGSLNGARHRGGNLVMCGTDLRLEGDERIRVHYLAGCKESGERQTYYLKKETRPAATDEVFHERDTYFVDHGRWAVGADGRVYTAQTRDSYTIHVYTKDGEIERIIERPYDPWKRTDGDKIRATNRVAQGARLGKTDIQIDDHDPAIVRLEVDRMGNLWVLGSRGNREQPEGVMFTWDVFDADGHFIKQIGLGFDGDGRTDRMYPLFDGRVLMVKNFEESYAAMFGKRGKAAGTTSMAPAEVVCLGRPGYTEDQQ